ncbi:MAG TPA: DUF4145 domain-containing protein [Allosphingosinicella sp.]|jgi:hypothetical protein
MLCPYCRTEFFESWTPTYLDKQAAPVMKGGPYDGRRLTLWAEVTTCPKCLGATVNLKLKGPAASDPTYAIVRIMPRSGPFPPPPAEVPPPIAADYVEANEVLPISPKAAAALARRCLQAILSSHGYIGRDLVKQVDAVLAETDASRALPTALRENIDAIRNFGNFSAHPITDQTTLQVIEVETGEAEWCLQLLIDLFDHYYVAPARAAAKRAALGAKLAAAGKPGMKS